MSTSLNDVASQIRASLAVSDPDLDTSIGTTTRKIVDAVAESVAQSYLDQHMLSYQYDIDSKIGAELDTFCQTIGGISRLAAKRASGVLTFTRTGPIDRTIFIPLTAQVNSNTLPLVTAQTLSSAVLLPNQSTLTVPAQAVASGPGGNVAPHVLTLLATSVEGVALVTNNTALTGGTLQETDEELRARWKLTAFRSMSGSESMYLGLALNDPAVTSAIVIGSSKRRREQVQIVGGSATSTVADCAYAFATGVYLGSNIDGGTMLIKDVDFTWDSVANPPRVVMAVTTYDTGVVDALGVPVRAPIDGAVLDLDFEYCPTSSRNDPVGLRWNGGAIMNRIDVWCAGQRPTAAHQSVVFSSAKRFTAALGSLYLTTRFVCDDGTSPTSGNVFLPLAFGPVVSLPDVLTMGGASYGRVGASGIIVDHPNAYRSVHDNSAFGFSATSAFGLEWAANALPPNTTVFTLGDNGDYLYNEVPRSVQAQVSRWRLVGTDALVHAAKPVALRFSVAVMYQSLNNIAVTNAAIDAAVILYLSQSGLGGVVQVSDIEQVIHNVTGVDNVRVLDTVDSPGWTYPTSNTFGLAIQRIVAGTPAQTYVSPSGQPLDVVFADSEAPVLESVVKRVKAQNSFHH